MVFRTEDEVKSFASAFRIIVLRNRTGDVPIPHWDRIVEKLVDDFRAAKKTQVDDVLEAAGAAALTREARAIEDQAEEVHERIAYTPASTFDVLLWQLEHARDFIEDQRLLDAIVAGVKRLAGPECNTELEQLMKAERTPRNVGEQGEA